MNIRVGEPLLKFYDEPEAFESFEGPQIFSLSHKSIIISPKQPLIFPEWGFDEDKRLSIISFIKAAPRFSITSKFSNFKKIVSTSRPRDFRTLVKQAAHFILNTSICMHLFDNKQKIH